MMATIENLQEELLLKIFSRYIRSEGHKKFLRNVPRVCKQWNKLSTEAPLWKDVFVPDLNYLQHLSRRGLLYNTQSLEFDHDGSFYEMNLSDVLKNIRDLKALDLKYNTVCRDTVKPVTENCPHLERLRLQILGPMTSNDMDQFLTVCGPTLKHLELEFFGSERGRQLVLGIAAKCPLLETFKFISTEVTPFPIHELRNGCPRIRELEFSTCQLINTERKDSSLDCGFKELKEFKAFGSDFSGFDVSRLLKDSMDLEHLTLFNNYNLVFGNILKIPSDKVRILDIKLKDPDENLKGLGDAVFKWRRTLSVLDLSFWKCDVSSVLDGFLQDNPNPQLNYLALAENIDLHFFQKFIQNCQSLIHIKIGWKEYKGRERIKEALELLVKEKTVKIGDWTEENFIE